jgi:hypothetical protein
MGGNA